MLKITKLIALGLFVVGASAMAQEQSLTAKGVKGPVFKYKTTVPSIAKQIANGTFKEASNEIREANPKRRGRNTVIPGKGSSGPDLALQTNAPFREGKDPINVFLADIASAGVTDPTGAKGPNHYLAAWNVGFRIFDNDGNELTPEASLGTILPGNTGGDPIVLYDQWNDRFIITEFDGPQVGGDVNGFEIAVSTGPDPVNDDWHVYTNAFPTSSFPDYTKFGIWSNGLYVTANISNNNRVFVVEYEKMLDGDDAQMVSFPLPGIITSGFYSPQPLNVTAGDLPDEDAPGYFIYMQDDAWSGVTEDHVKVWKTTVDWDNVGDSEIELSQQIVTEEFIGVFDGGSFSNIPQGGGANQDALQATIMNQAQYRRFDGYNSMIFNFVVDTDPSAGKRAGIRWYELRQTGGDDEDWDIFQEGTYVSPNDNLSAYQGSMVMDDNGNIGMGYITSGPADRIAMQYTGRMASDPLNEMTVDETLVIQSTAANPSNRLADYTHTVLDTDGLTMWYIAEAIVGSKRNYVGVFKIDDGTLSTPDFVDSEEDFTISTSDNNNFNLQLNTTKTDEGLVVTVYNITGQVIAENHITKDGGSYNYNLDMSYTSSGVYIVKIHNNKSGISKKILVK